MNILVQMEEMRIHLVDFRVGELMRKPSLQAVKASDFCSRK